MIINKYFRILGELAIFYDCYRTCCDMCLTKTHVYELEHGKPKESWKQVRKTYICSDDCLTLYILGIM